MDQRQHAPVPPRRSRAVKQNQPSTKAYVIFSAVLVVLVAVIFTAFAVKRHNDDTLQVASGNDSSNSVVTTDSPSTDPNSVLPPPPTTTDAPQATTPPPSPKPTQPPVQQVTTAPAYVPPPVSQPTHVATHVPSPPPPKPSTCGAPANPFGYNFCGGATITSPDPSVCDYFKCIASFWKGHGYMEECADGTYSMSGGIQGACSYHDGELRPVYA